MDHPLNTDLRPLRGQPPPAKPEKARPRAPCVSSSRDAPRKLLNKYFNIIYAHVHLFNVKNTKLLSLHTCEKNISAPYLTMLTACCM